MKIGKSAFWKFFEEISNIPRGSGNVQGISDYLVNFAKERNLKYVQDDILNVVIYKDAAEGYEEKQTVIFQGHMDMVAISDSAEIDMEKDPIKLVVSEDGEWLSADKTTLGADDGIAVAYMLAMLDDKELKAPALEMVFTVDEETGLNGAFAFDGSLLKGKKMINIDNEEEGIFIGGCAGGATVESLVPVEWKDRKANAYRLKVKGLTGGHSGMEINKGRISAASVIARFLCQLKLCRTRIISINVGLKDNAIADSGEISFICSAPKPDVYENVEFYIDALKDEYAHREPNIEFEFECLGEGIDVHALHKADSERITDFLLALPQGVKEMSPLVPDAVETSDNVGVIKLTEEGLITKVLVRSSYESAKQALVDKVIAVTELAGGKAEVHADYPGWAYVAKSELREELLAAYKESTGKKAKVEVIHAGVECGIFTEKIEGLDVISIGPEMHDVHTPKEKLSIPSAEKYYDFLASFLAK